MQRAAHTSSGLYVHIPYCHSKCAYCDFYSTPVRVKVENLIDCLIKEYDIRAWEQTLPVRTIYIGGGTPSILTVDQLKRLCEALPTGNIEEFTIEANPEDITEDKVHRWVDLGINRVSMGVQSLNDDELRIIGRRHTAQQAIDAYHTIRRAGINNISLDLIYGLPEQTIESWSKSLETVLGLRPDHLSAYILSYEPKTRLTALLNRGDIQAVEDDDIISMNEILIAKTRERGYRHYEISNFALDGYIAKHNSGYWNSTPYLGLGPSAHSFDGRLRRVNPDNQNTYMSKIEQGEPAYEVEKETRAERFDDLVITRLRTDIGLDFAEVPVAMRLGLLNDAYPYIKSGEIILRDNHLIIPEKHWLISDSIIRDLLQG